MKRQWTSWTILVALMSVMTLPVQAAMMSTEQVVQTQQAQVDRQHLTQMLDRTDVQDQLVAMGVSADDVQQRVAAMTDTEVAQLNGQLADLPAGEGVLGVVALIFVVFVITDVVGATDIFPFIHPVR
ncbi:MAG: PA2779 family protein [Hydrogenovibrio sp.]|uniref:DUF6627 family protein n=1 Tax=Hydrogenovibrio sp. TaxID=2065821 RepID=UPI00286FED63|nr:DUF6627 family protein [Hydrogenovibrio sp.]MDR9498338.1 PA2779 family protein [Hydrogenovibrio sp.]